MGKAFFPRLRRTRIRDRNYAAQVLVWDSSCCVELSLNWVASSRNTSSKSIQSVAPSPIAAIAFEAPEEVAREVSRVYAGENRAFRQRITNNHGDLVTEAVAAAEDNELAATDAIQRHERSRNDDECLRLLIAI